MRLPFGWRLEKEPRPEPEPQAKPRPRVFRRPSSRLFQAGVENNLLADWTTTPYTADETLRMQLRTLRARSREQTENNPFLRKFDGMVRANIVGPKGVVLQARARDDKGKLDRAANQAIEEAWEAWGSSKDCDVCGRLTWVEMQSLIVSTVKTDGEVFVRRYRGTGFGPYGIAYQVLDPELLDIDKQQVLPNGNVIRMGVELNQLGRAVAYWISDVEQRPDGGIAQYRRNYIRVPAEDIIHVYVVSRPGQTRGAPWTSTALYRLKQSGAYDDAAVIAARIGASKMGFITSETGTEYQGDATDSDGTPIDEVEPGILKQLAQGQTFTSFSPDYPRGEYAEFQRAVLRGIASGLLVSHPSLAQDFAGVTYSSGRLSLLEERDMWKTMQAWFVSAFCAPVYRQWLETALLSGEISPGKAPLIQGREDRYQRIAWHPRRWEWVDPQKEMIGAKIAINSRIKSIFSVIRDTTQDDPEDVLEEIAYEQKRMKALGIEPTETLSNLNLPVDVVDDEPPPEEDKPTEEEE